MIIDDQERELAGYGLSAALGHGLSGARVTLSKSVSNSLTMLDGEVDKISRCADRSLTFCLFADGRYGTFSTNRLGRSAIDGFVAKACETVMLMEKDGCRTLPQKSRLAKDAVTGLESGLWDGAVQEIRDEERMNSLRSMRLKTRKGDGWETVSEENEYSDYVEENYVVDSQGFEGRSAESAVSCSSEVTVRDRKGGRYSAYWWDTSARADRVHPETCAETALRRAVAKLNPAKVKSGVYRTVVDGNVASKLLSPITDALNGFCIQQKMSFLAETRGRKMFSEGLTLTDMAREFGKAGARLFDSEGVATTNLPLIKDGVVQNYFINTYISNKTGESPTVEDISRPVLTPWDGFDGDGFSRDGLNGDGFSCDGFGDDGLRSGEKSLSLEDIVRRCGEGMLITGFNGGNCNPVTGDYSFGVSGFLIEDGRAGRPFREMLVTGNIIRLWNSLLAVGGDARDCGRWRMPALAFDGVNFSA